VTGGYDAALFERLAEVEPRSFWYRARARLVVDVLRRRFPGARSVLEVGSGAGGMLAALRHAFPDMRLVGAEPASEALAIARRRLPADVVLVQADAASLELGPDFDVVCALDVLEHVDDDRGALERLREVLRPNGGIVVLVPQHRWLWSEMDRIARHVRRYGRRELCDKLRRSGFEVLETSSFVSLLLPAMVVSRAVRRGRYDPVRELAPGPLNGVFERVLDGERRLIARGVSFPFGGSLLVVGRRR
jgi:SAM-dependent methyltransferase